MRTNARVASSLRGATVTVHDQLGVVAGFLFAGEDAIQGVYVPAGYTVYADLFGVLARAVRSHQLRGTVRRIVGKQSEGRDRCSAGLFW